MTCYVYLWFRPNGTPLYVGWGKHRAAPRRPRWADHLENSTNRHLRGVFKKYGKNLPIVILREDLTVTEAKGTERAFIAAIGRFDLGRGPLVNRTDGGDGLSNPSAETRNRIGTANRGRKYGPPSAETRAKISASNTGRLFSETHRKSIGKANAGRKRSVEFKSKISKTMTGRSLSEEHKQNLRKPHGPIGPMSPEQRLKISVSSRGRKPSVETRAKLSLAATIAWADPEIRARQVASIQAAAPQISAAMKRVRRNGAA